MRRFLGCIGLIPSACWRRSTMSPLPSLRRCIIVDYLFGTIFFHRSINEDEVLDHILFGVAHSFQKIIEGLLIFLIIKPRFPSWASKSL